MSTRERPRAGAADFGILLNVAFGTFKESLHEHLAAAGFDDLGGSFGYVLRTLERDRQGLSLKDLAAALGVTPQGTLKIVEDMVAKGYVDRATDERDSRVRRLSVAPRGASLLREARKFHARFEADLAARLGARSVAEARKVLEALAVQPTRSAGTRMQLL